MRSSSVSSITDAVFDYDFRLDISFSRIQGVPLDTTSSRIYLDGS